MPTRCRLRISGLFTGTRTGTRKKSPCHTPRRNDAEQKTLTLTLSRPTGEGTAVGRLVICFGSSGKHGAIDYQKCSGSFSPCRRSWRWCEAEVTIFIRVEARVEVSRIYPRLTDKFAWGDFEFCILITTSEDDAR